jgi:hypothetical protein
MTLTLSSDLKDAFTKVYTYCSADFVLSAGADLFSFADRSCVGCPSVMSGVFCEPDHPVFPRQTTWKDFRGRLQGSGLRFLRDLGAARSYWRHQFFLQPEAPAHPGAYDGRRPPSRSHP